LGGFDSHTLPPPLITHAAFDVPRALIIALLLIVAVIDAPPAGAQVRVDTATILRGPGPRDSIRTPLSPGKAFLNSMMLPGLGQARLQRHVPGAFYWTVEAVSFAMLFKTASELRIAKARAKDMVVARYKVDPTDGAPVLDPDGAFIPVDSVANPYDADLVNARRSQFEDWVALIVFNHLFSGADAFVSSLLWDVPARVGFRPAPAGIGAGLYVRW